MLIFQHEVVCWETYCHLLGSWLPEKFVKATYLVPKSLKSKEQSSFFGVGEAVLSDSRNGEQSVSYILTVTH